MTAASKRPLLRVESRLGNQIVSFFEADAAPVSLAVARIVVFLALVRFAPISQAVNFASLPAELRFPPAGLGWLNEFIPINPTAVRVTAALMVVAAMMAAAGFLTRWSGWVAVIAGIYVLGVPNFFGKVDHYHFLIWFPAILASAPSADALSIDALLARRRGAPTPRGRHRRYGLPLRCIWALIGLIYFFPGLYKLAAGWEWVFTDNLRYRLIDRGLLDGGPMIRIDGLPDPVLWAVAGGVIAFELGFVFALLNPRLRPWAVVSGLMFHVGTLVFMEISFQSLMVMYVVFVPWDRVADKIGWRGEHGVEDASPGGDRVWRSSVLVGSVLIGLTIWTGVAHVSNGWPVALFPTFEDVLTDEVSRLETVGVVDGEERSLDVGERYPWMPAHRREALLTRIASDADPPRLAALWEAGASAAPADLIRLYRISGTRIEGSAELAAVERQLLLEARP